MTARFWAVVDWLAHLAYCPTMLGHRSAVTRWHHGVHLIPGALLERACHRYDFALGVTETELHRR